MMKEAREKMGKKKFLLVTQARLHALHALQTDDIGSRSGVFPLPKHATAPL